MAAPPLLYELIQNANDAHAEKVSFTVSDEGLTVWNSGVFPTADTRRNSDNARGRSMREGAAATFTPFGRWQGDTRPTMMRLPELSGWLHRCISSHRPPRTCDRRATPCSG